jgi:class 3 adenylate cyclase
MERRLAAILAAAVVGYSRLMGADEEGTLAALKARRRDILQPMLAKHHGRIAKVMGDSVLVEFASAVSAVQCAVDLQQAMTAANSDLSGDRHTLLRVGVNLGDVIVEGKRPLWRWCQHRGAPGGDRRSRRRRPAHVRFHRLWTLVAAQPG